MKQQMKRMVAEQIRTLENDIKYTNYEVDFFSGIADKENSSHRSASAFDHLNYFRTVSRKQKAKLVKLVSLQKEIKSMIGYINYDYVNSEK